MKRTDWYDLNKYGIYWDQYGASTPQDELDEYELGERVVDWMLDETLVRIYHYTEDQEAHASWHFALHMLKMIHMTMAKTPMDAEWTRQITEMARRLDNE